MIDYYEIFEVSPKAGQDVIRAVYKILMQRYGSHKDPNSAETVQMIISAYDVLSDPEKRKAYDIELDKAKNENIKFSRNQNFDERATGNTPEISRQKSNKVVNTTRSKRNISDDSSILSRLNWNKWGWVLSILAVVFLLISMVRPDPEKVKRGQLAVELEAKREREELEAELRKNVTEGKKAKTSENERKVVEPAKEKSARTNAVDPVP